MGREKYYLLGSKAAKIIGRDFSLPKATDSKGTMWFLK
jgi:hypothetical protein